MPGDSDDFGLDDEEAAEPVTYETVWELQQRRSEERGDQGETSDSDWVGFFLPDVALHTADSVTDALTGETYELVGEPERLRNPRTTIFSHIEAPIRRTAGASEEGS